MRFNRKPRLGALLAGLALLVFSAGPASGADSRPFETPGASGSPYFFVKSDDPETDALPLQSTAVDASIAGVIADVTVTQVYSNEGENPLEAVYVFPASTRAAVYGMQMTIGERTITARIEERKAAREAYAAAREKGQSASLLEQERPNVFQMNVANIMPGDAIRVELKYTEVLVPEGGVYRFVYPTVVGPRYTGTQGGHEPGAESWTENPYLHEGEAPASTLDIAVRLNAGMPIAEIACPTHQTDLRFKGKTAAAVSLADSEERGGNRDFILKYRLSGSRINSGLMLYEGPEENYFLLVMQPPERVAADAVPGREYIFVVDVSGSMNGFPLDTAKSLLRDLIGRLRPSDRFNVLLFAGGSSVFSEQSVAAASENATRAIRFIESRRGGGGTQLLPALSRALALPAAEGYSRTLVVATDGYVNAEKEAFDLIRKKLGEANLFSFGIGSSVNRFLIEGMARAGAGEPFVVTRPSAAANAADRFRRMIERPVLTDIAIDYGRFSAYAVEPPAVPDMFAERPVVVYGKWKGRPNGVIRLSGQSGSRRFEREIDAAGVRPDPENAALRHLWARQRIAVLSDFNHLSPDKERKAEIIRLGLKYSLLTDYTSFVAIDKRVRNEDGSETTTVRQPLPLPRGVSDLAVGRGSARAAAYKSVAARPMAETARPPLAPVSKAPAADPQQDAAGGAKVDLRVVQITGDVSRRQAEASLGALAPALESCFQGEATGISGLLALTLRVDARGRIQGITDITDPPASGGLSETLRKCLEDAFKKHPFPASADQAPYEMRVAVKTR
jgi:Ca-activated chloride channel family protein